MATDKKVEQEAASVEEISIDAFLKSLDADNLLKSMFRHYLGKVQAANTATKEAFQSLFDAFKDLPYHQLP